MAGRRDDDDPALTTAHTPIPPSHPGKSHVDPAAHMQANTPANTPVQTPAKTPAQAPANKPLAAPTHRGRLLAAGRWPLSAVRYPLSAVRYVLSALGASQGVVF